MSDYHEPTGELSGRDRDFHRALTSLKEEIEAIDWYQQRVTMSTNGSLSSILAHNRDEEIEHAAMVLEWLRRNMPGWDEMLRRYLFSEAPIVAVEEGRNDSEGSLAIGRIDSVDEGGG